MKKHSSKLNIGLSAPNGTIAVLFRKEFSKKLNFFFYKNNINNTKKFKNWLKLNNKINVFVNFAAITSKNECEFNKKKTFQVNYKSVVKMLENIKKQKLENFYYFLSLSSSHVFKKSNIKLNENSIKKPTSYYGQSKLLMEKYILKNKKKYKFKIGIARIFNYYARNSKKRFFINDVRRKMMSKKKYLTFKAVDTYRDFVQIDDLLNSILFMIENNLEGDYNICSGKKVYLKTLIKDLNLKYKKKIYFVDTNQKSLFGSNKKIVNKGFNFIKDQKIIY